MNLAHVAVALTVGAAGVAAQSSTELVALGDAAYKGRRQDAALAYFVRAIAAGPDHYEALWKASRSEIDLAEIAPDRTARDARLAAGQRHAEEQGRDCHGGRPPGHEAHLSERRGDVGHPDD